MFKTEKIKVVFGEILKKIAPEKTKEEKEKEKNFGLSPADYERLCSEVKVGNKATFDKEYRAHFKKIRNYTAKRCNVFFPEQVEDSTLTAFSIFLNELKKEKIPDYGNLEAYVVTIAKNHYARQKTVNTSRITKNLANETTNDRLFDHSDIVELMEIFENLCAFCRQFLKYLHWENRKQEELLELMSFPTVAAVKVKHASIKLKLREAFLKHQGNQKICQKLCETGKNKKDI